MALIYNRNTEEGNSKCFIVNDFNTAWIDRLASGTTFTMAYGTRFGAGLEETKKNGIVWTYEQLPEFHKMMEWDGLLQKMEQECMKTSGTVSHVTEDGSKTFEVLFCGGHGRKIQISREDGKFCRVPIVKFHYWYRSMKAHFPEHKVHN
jgi:hypothetical protein